MMAFAPWQALLNGLGWVLAQIYDLVPNYGVSIILLTVVIRLILLPLGIKQIRSMQHMQIVQPRIKQLQQKYKGNKQRQQEEIMKLYREYGVNPFSGCWPVLLQFPILIAMYSVLRWPQHPIHVPLESELCAAVSEQIPQQIPVCDPNGEPITSQAQVDDLGLPGPPGGTTFLATNLLCSAGLPWQDAPSTLPDRVTVDDEAVELIYPVDCASTPLERVPYYVFAVLMFGTTFYQQRQMQKASPPGAASSQQQALLKVMPILFGVFGIFFPAGLVVYWTTSNLWQIGQQHFMLKTRPTEEDMASSARSKPQKAEKKGFMASMLDRAEQERNRRETGTGKPASRKPGTPKSGNPKPGNPKPGTKKPGSGPRKPGSGGSGSGGDPKKRPKR
jgi:YidC/Oxa1 family membrane protein insertase